MKSKTIMCLIVVSLLISICGCSNCEEKAEKQINEAKKMLSEAREVLMVEDNEEANQKALDAVQIAKEVVKNCPTYGPAYPLYISSIFSTLAADTLNMDMSVIKEYIETINNGIPYLREEPEYGTIITMMFMMDRTYYQKKGSHIVPAREDFLREEFAYWRSKENPQMMNALIASTSTGGVMDSSYFTELFNFAEWMGKEYASDSYMIENVVTPFKEKSTKMCEEYTKNLVQRKKSRVSEAKLILKQIFVACNTYYKKHGEFPPVHTFNDARTENTNWEAKIQDLYIDRPSGYPRFTYKIVKGGSNFQAEASAEYSYDASLHDVSTIVIDKDGIITGGTR